MDIKDINLNAPALPDDESSTETPTDGSQPEQEVEEQKDEATADSEADNDSQEETEVEEARIPYSRFKTVRDEKETAMERAIRAEAELEVYKRQTTQATSEDTGELPDYWVELFGDSDQSRKAFAAEQRRMAAIREEATTSAIEAIERRNAEAEQQVEETVENMESAFVDYQGRTKRTLSDAEQSSILDIMDELTPKDAQGNYDVDPTVFLEKAVELYDLRQLKATGKTREARRKAATLAGATTDDAPTNDEGSTHFKAGQWDSWRNNPLLPKD